MRWSTLALFFAAAGCAATPAAVPVSGPQAEIAALAGEWTGEYESTETGRSGSLYFRLPASADTARGDVVMSPRMPVVQQGVVEGRPQLAPAPAPVLSVRFIRAGGGVVTGVLDPYTDPDCGCTATTTFTGRMHGDRIEGTYSTRTAGTTHHATGRWSVVRTSRKR